MVNTVLRFYKNIFADENHRYKSWEHCFNYFNSTNINTDQGALHLAFYLASWGMYRGSSGLLWKDYKVHTGAIKIIEDSEYQFLKRVRLEDDIAKYKNKLNSLYEELMSHYSQIEYSNGKGKKTKFITATPTLITKIILGTTGAFPALDRLFCEGFKKDQRKHISTLKNSMDIILDFAKSNNDDILKIQKEICKINNSKILYPVMKIVDMYFWEIGAYSEKDR